MKSVLVIRSALKIRRATAASVFERELISHDFDSIGSLHRLKVLRVAECRQPFDLRVLTLLPELEDVTLAKCKVQLDSLENVRVPKLKRFWLNPVKDEVVSRISRALPSAMVCNGSVLEIGGVRQPSIQVFYEQH